MQYSKWRRHSLFSANEAAVEASDVRALTVELESKILSPNNLDLY